MVSAARITRLDEVNVLEQPSRSKLDTVSFQPGESKFLKLTLR
jgi:hypothetical protein